MICRNLMTTLDDGRSITCRFPRFSALDSVLRASPSTLIRTMTNRTSDDAAGAGRTNENGGGARRRGTGRSEAVGLDQTMRFGAMKTPAVWGLTERRSNRKPPNSCQFPATSSG